MGTGYTRNDTANNIADGNVINASDLDGEFDAVQAAFNGTTGHSHDGTTGEGPQIDTAGIATDAIDGTKIADDSIDSEHYVDGSIDTAHIANDAVTGDKLANNIQIAGTLGVTGETTLTTHLNMGDNDTIKLGAGPDLQIYHNGSSSYIDQVGTGTLYLRNTTDDFDVVIQSDDGAGGLATYFGADGSSGQAKMMHYGSLKLNTKTDGVDITGELQADSLDIDGNADISGNLNMSGGGNVDLTDNAQLRLGTSQDLLIYHDGSHSRIDDTGTGSLILRGNGAISLQKYTGETMAQFTADAAVALYYDNAQKLATTSTGVSVTGTASATTFSGDLNGTINTATTATTQSAGDNTTKVATTAFVTTAVNNAEPFPSGTSMLFQQTAAPTGWTKQTTHNDKAIRLTTGTVGTGGSSAFSTALATPSVAGGAISGNPTNNHSVSSGNLAATAGNLAVSMSGNISSTTLTTNQIPAHTHATYNNGGNNPQTTYFNKSGGYTNSPNGSNSGMLSSGGNGGSHNHGHNLSGTMSGSPGLTGNPTLSGNVTAGNLAVGASTASINVNYVDFIIANKD